MNYNEAVSYYDNLSRYGMKLGLERIGQLLEKVGSPHKEQKYIHIAGTNGKGSIANFTHNVLVDAGYKVGLYTSPHLIKLNETIKVDKDFISDEEFAQITSRIKNVIQSDSYLSREEFTYYEVLTASALMYFQEKGCDLVILEVGLGGRLDATNVIEKPLVSVISKISYDHMNVLGNTIEEITGEKAGIIKDNSLVVLSPQEFGEVQSIVESVCDKHKATLRYVDIKEVCTHNCSTEFQQCFDYKNIKDIKIRLLGKHQIANASTAIEVILGLKGLGITISEGSILRGLFNTSWQCRLELVINEPKVFIDGAHNIDGINTVIDFFKTTYKDRKIKFIFGVLKDKSYKEMVGRIAPLAESIFTVSPKSDRALDAEELSKVVMEHNINTKAFIGIKEAVHFTLSQAEKEDIICICGSLYYVGEARNLLVKDIK